MGYLSNNDLTVDAILTKAGRAKLAAGQGLDIAKFALADDEIDYSLYEPAHPLGSAYYDYAIKNIPVIEASPDESQSMRFKIFTADKGLTVVPRIANLGNTTTTYTYRYNTSAILTAKTFTLATTGGVTESYTVILGNNKLGALTSVATQFNITSPAGTSQGIPQTLVTSEGVARPQVSFGPYNNLAIGTYTTTITITGNMSGATVSIPVTISVTA